MNKIVFALLLAAVPAAVSAMPLSVFLPKAEALKKKGAMALFSSDMGVVKKQFSIAAQKVVAERRATVKAGGKPAYCPPAGAKIDTDDLLNHLRAIPAAQRGMTFTAAYKSFLVRKFPCPA